jgi:hypothetical protein
MQFEDHPTVRNLAKRVPDVSGRQPGVQDAALLRRIAVDHGADDVGIVEIGRPTIEPQRAEILRNYPWTKSLLSFVASRYAALPVPSRTSNFIVRATKWTTSPRRSLPSSKTVESAP